MAGQVQEDSGGAGSQEMALLKEAFMTE